MKTIVLIDGGYLRVKAKKANRIYNQDFIEKFALKCKLDDEVLLRILYYDCAPYSGRVSLPISGTPFTFTSNDSMLNLLAEKDLFAVRRGVLKFRGYKPKNTPAAPNPGIALTDADFYADFEQKGVDMRIGLDIATYASDRLVERIILVSNDTDCVPAIKFARKSGLQTVLIKLPNGSCSPELVRHSDFKRPIDWP